MRGENIFAHFEVPPQIWVDLKVVPRRKDANNKQSPKHRREGKYLMKRVDARGFGE
jgi:hypothetical protein